MPDPAPWPDYKYFRRLFQLDVTWFFAPNYGNPPIPITSTSAATIKARAFRGPDGMWQPTYYYNEAADNNGAHNAEQYRWELTDQYPERPELSIVAEGVTITSDIPGEGEEQYAGMRYIGRVTFVQETGSFAFAPA
jgi:hypothetical protein